MRKRERKSETVVILFAPLLAGKKNERKEEREKGLFVRRHRFSHHEFILWNKRQIEGKCQNSNGLGEIRVISKRRYFSYLIDDIF